MKCLKRLALRPLLKCYSLSTKKLFWKSISKALTSIGACKHFGVNQHFIWCNMTEICWMLKKIQIGCPLNAKMSNLWNVQWTIGYLLFCGGIKGNQIEHPATHLPALTNGLKMCLPFTVGIDPSQSGLSFLIPHYR